MKQTIEVYTLNLRKRKGRVNLSFSDGSDIYELMKKEFVAYIDQVKTEPVNGAEKRTIKVPPSENGNPFWGYNDEKRYVFPANVNFRISA